MSDQNYDPIEDVEIQDEIVEGTLEADSFFDGEDASEIKNMARELKKDYGLTVTGNPRTGSAKVVGDPKKMKAMLGSNFDVDRKELDSLFKNGEMPSGSEYRWTYKESLEEMAEVPKAKGSADMEVDGEKAADEIGKTVKKSAPAQTSLPKTKAAMLKAAYDKMSKMKKDEMKAAYEAMCGESFETDEDAIVEGNFDEDLNALVDSEATLSEGFKEKAEVIFEAALKVKLSEHVDRLESQYAEELAEETTRVQNDLVEKVDGYLNYVVENWMEENKIAIENGLRTEIAESFIQALHGVFTEHYIEVPEGKADLVDDLANKVDELEEQLNSTVEKNIDLKEEVAKLTRDAIIVESSAGLSEAQAEKLKGLVEDVNFENAETFAKKVDTIKESYFKQQSTEAQPMQEETAEGSDEVEVSPMMAQYLAAIKKSSQ